MIWLIIGDLVGLLVVVPTLHRTFGALQASLTVIDQALGEVVAECQRIVPALDGVPALAQTQTLTAAVPSLVGRYVGELEPLLPTH